MNLHPGNSHHRCMQGLLPFLCSSSRTVLSSACDVLCKRWIKIHPTFKVRLVQVLHLGDLALATGSLLIINLSLHLLPAVEHLSENSQVSGTECTQCQANQGPDDTVLKDASTSTVSTGDAHHDKVVVNGVHADALPGVLL
jgi:hypothetical protein